MKKSNYKYLIYILAGVCIFFISGIIGCSLFKSDLPDNQTGNLCVLIHDKQIDIDGKTINNLFITIKRIDIVKQEGEEKITIMDLVQTIDILKVYPVFL